MSHKNDDNIEIFKAFKTKYSNKKTFSVFRSFDKLILFNIDFSGKIFHIYENV